MNNRKQNVRKTLIDLLHNWAVEQPQKLLYCYIEDGDMVSESVTFQQFVENVNVTASVIADRCPFGSRVLLLCPSGIEFMTGFFACLQRGLIAVPVAVPPLARLSVHLDRLKTIIHDAKPELVLTVDSILHKMDDVILENLEIKRENYISLSRIPSSVQQFTAFSEVKIKPETTAFLQYTSGSTSTPKGVVITHKNIVENEKMIYKHFGHSQESSLVSWLPLFHDMGLIGSMLQPVYAGITCYFMSPMSFLQAPFRWLKTISKFKLITSGGPNFAYDLCNRKISEEQVDQLDLSGWQVAFCGSELVQAHVIDTFYEKFKKCGFKRSSFFPCYGMAEATLFISGSVKNSEPKIAIISKEQLGKNYVVDIPESENARNVVSCGKPATDSKIEIVHPENFHPVTENSVGEIWVQGKHIAAGYWNRQELTNDVFNAEKADDKSRPWLRTGDLGFVRNNELYITGRIKDIIIINGHNYYPEDLEKCVQDSHEFLQPHAGAAFSVDSPEGEKLVVVQELKRFAVRKESYEEVYRIIQENISRCYDLVLEALVLVKPESVPKTTSGKIRRSHCRLNYLQNTLINVAAVYKAKHENLELSPNSTVIIDSKLSIDYNGICTWLTQRISKLSNQPLVNISIEQPFTSFGIDSVNSVAITGELQKLLKRDVSPVILYDYPTIHELALHLSIPHSSDEMIELKHVEPSSSDGEQKENNCIAVVGMACRFPDAPSIDEYWKLLINKKDAVKLVPEQRWDRESFYSADVNAAGKIINKRGGFVEDIDCFDPSFFGITPLEAEVMDPQHRLILEVGWEALENANMTLEQLSGSNTGVFVGMSTNDFGHMLFKRREILSGASGTGTLFCLASNRLSYFLNIHGPSLSLDTACSSSLVALHLAKCAILRGECDIALVGGVNAILAPEISISCSKAGILSPDGSCKTFDETANGYVRSEGCGVLVLRRLSDAIKEKNNIYGVISGSKINHCGMTNGIKAPSGELQRSAILGALKDARLTPDEFSYIETHGTGTSLGDTIEYKALHNIFGSVKNDSGIFLGAVKTNIGHLESAAGMASIIKVLLSLKNKTVPANLHLNKLNPNIKIEGTSFKFPVESSDWYPDKGRRIAGVSSFGFGGANSFVVVEEFSDKNQNDSENEEIVPTETMNNSMDTQVLLLSAKTNKALQLLCMKYADYIEQHPDISFGDICTTAALHRTSFRHRCSIVGSKAEVIRGLKTISESTDSDMMYFGEKQKETKMTIAFLFSGQGAQYSGMGKSLYLSNKTFRESIDECTDIAGKYMEISILDLLYDDSLTQCVINSTRNTQPLIFTIEYALSKMWKEFGITADIVLGHSVGEYAAACYAGVFSLEDSLKMICTRGRLMQELPENGSMISIFTTPEKVEKMIKPYSDEVSVAGYNSPSQTVISGRSEIVDIIGTECGKQKIKYKKLSVSHAFHSPLMIPMLDAFSKVVRTVKYNNPVVPVVSTVTGVKLLTEIADPDYWLQHIRLPVKFTEAINNIHDYDVFLEIGPGNTLVQCGRETLDPLKRIWLESINRKIDDHISVKRTLGKMYCHEAGVNLKNVFPNDYKKVILPAYAYDKKRYWFSPENKNEDQKPVSVNLTGVQQLLDGGEYDALASLVEANAELKFDNQATVNRVINEIIKIHFDQKRTLQFENFTYDYEWHNTRILKENELRVHKEEMWLIFCDPDETIINFQKELNNKGIPHKFVLSENKSSIDPCQNIIDPCNIENLQKMLNEMKEKSLTVLYLWDYKYEGFDTNVHELYGRFRSLFTLLKCFTLIKMKIKPSIFIPRKIQAFHNIKEVYLPLVCRVFWSMLKVSVNENIFKQAAIIGLDEKNAGNFIRSVFSGIVTLQKNNSKEWFIGLVEQNGYVPRLCRKKISYKNSGFEVNSDGAYLITGGTGGIGAKVIEMLVSKGARYICIINKSGSISDKLEKKYEQWVNNNVRLTVNKVNLNEYDDVKAFVNHIHRDIAPLSGIFHCAGIIDDASIRNTDWERITAITAPKINGGINLHNAVNELDLDCFVMFSSVSQDLGLPGQIGYVIGNAFLSALAEYRVSQGKSSSSVSWGGWSNTGMITQLERKNPEITVPLGIIPMNPERCMEFLDVFVNNKSISTIFSDLEIDQITKSAGNSELTSMLDMLLTDEQRKSLKENILIPSLKSDLQELHEIDRKEYIVTQIQILFRKTLKIDHDDGPDRYQGFFTMGLDSIMLTNILKKLESQLDLNIPPTAAFEHSTIDALSDYILNSLFHTTLATEEIFENTVSDNLDETLDEDSFDNMSDKEAEILLTEKLEQLSTKYKL